MGVEGRKKVLKRVVERLLWYFHYNTILGKTIEK